MHRYAERGIRRCMSGRVEKKMDEYQDNSLRGRVFRQLRENILSGVYKENDRSEEVV